MGLEDASVNWMLEQCKSLNCWKMFGFRWIALGLDLAAPLSASQASQAVSPVLRKSRSALSGGRFLGIRVRVAS